MVRSVNYESTLKDVGFALKNLNYLKNTSGENDATWGKRLGMRVNSVAGMLRGESRIKLEVVIKAQQWYEKHGELHEKFTLDELVNEDFSLSNFGRKINLQKKDLETLEQGVFHSKLNELDKRTDDNGKKIDEILAILKSRNQNTTQE